MEYVVLCCLDKTVTVPGVCQVAILILSQVLEFSDSSITDSQSWEYLTRKGLWCMSVALGHCILWSPYVGVPVPGKYSVNRYFGSAGPCYTRNTTCFEQLYEKAPYKNWTLLLLLRPPTETKLHMQYLSAGPGISVCLSLFITYKLFILNIMMDIRMP